MRLYVDHEVWFGGYEYGCALVFEIGRHSFHLIEWRRC